MQTDESVQQSTGAHEHPDTSGAFLRFSKQRGVLEKEKNGGTVSMVSRPGIKTESRSSFKRHNSFPQQSELERLCRKP